MESSFILHEFIMCVSVYLITALVYILGISFSFLYNKILRNILFMNILDMKQIYSDSQEVLSRVGVGDNS